MIYLILFWSFFKIGLFTFGGGYAMIPMIEAEVMRYGWLEEAELINFVAVSESTPGPIAVNIATYVGTETAGILGSICATLGVVLPSFVIILIIAKCFEKFRKNKIVSGCMSGLKPAVVGMIGTALLSVGKTVLFPKGMTKEVFFEEIFYLSAGIFVLTAFLAFRKVHPILVICISAALGIVLGFALNLPC